MADDIIKGYVTIIVFPQRSYEVLSRSPSDPEVPDTELTPLLMAWAQGHAPLIQKATGYRLEYWKDDTLHYQWYEGEDLLEGEGTEPVLEPVDESEEAELERLRAERAIAVENILVEKDGMSFEGDETSQNRMSRALVAVMAKTFIEKFGINPTTKWVLDDNSVQEVTMEQLADVLLQSGLKQTELWVVPYTETSDDVQ